MSELSVIMGIFLFWALFPTELGKIMTKQSAHVCVEKMGKQIRPF